MRVRLSILGVLVYGLSVFSESVGMGCEIAMWCYGNRDGDEVTVFEYSLLNIEGEDSQLTQFLTVLSNYGTCLFKES